MKQLKVSGVIIAENNMGDYDKMVTLLTPNLGKISCSARGARRSKSLLLSEIGRASCRERVYVLV